MPTPDPRRLDDTEDDEEAPRRVAGTVRLMTEDPFEIDETPQSGMAQRFAGLTTAKPWLIPVALMGIGVTFLVLRRRR
jgi:hypothetical protein